MDDLRMSAGETLAETAARLSAEFETRAAQHDAEDSFVAENVTRLRDEGLLRAGVPAELGGGGAGLRELATMLRVIGRGCGSTALALAMHTHGVATPAWRWRHQPQARAAVEPLLRRVAQEGAVLVTSGGSDWIGGSGRAERVEGGYRIHARKIFASGSPAGTLLTTSAVAGDRVIHFAVPMSAPEVRPAGNWQVLGMRGTGSQDLEIDGFFVPDDKVALIREAGCWHPLWHIIVTMAFPLIYSAYLGVAEGARDLALKTASGRSRNHRLAGEMETALFGAAAAVEAMLAAAEENRPGPDSVNRVMMGRRLAEEQAIRTVELAMELAGGASFFRAGGLERRFRDIQGARFHPMRREVQHTYAGAMAFGDPVDRVF